ncbi:Bug family tripartite tricarboxylate transporter substrate binding protein [Sulfitobacter geojensis]|uniref:Bug family tripartite tricarboxylate transporter substrate binding protein n=1 Tax=Sulfitobacter geojensis TaxID=1342299 RepID=UPI00046A13D0|nr:tripartite tricarboxylate transporter substrate binding protein [Sulfitobacter geojensis]KHA54050.1 hypothetical protein Z947_79 [Sulfitobacter geojensis]NYI29868.1 tripartite-type tricarboxylate transporter receptor subunit TctC [Sulfitobacter geojensis]
MQTKNKLTKIAIATIASLGAMSSSAVSQTIEMIVPFGAGGGTDSVARVFEQDFSAALGASVVIRNVTGASGSVGAQAAADAAPDGFTIAYLPIGPASIQPLLRPGTYGADSWEYICRTVNDPAVLMVQKNGPITSFEDITKQQEIVYGSAGAASTPHVAMAALSTSLGITGLHIPYQGTADGMRGMAGGEVEIYADLPSVVKAFDVKPLGIFASERQATFPDVPTMAELGHPLNFSVWHGLFAPAGTPPERIKEFEDACETAVASANFVEKMTNLSTTTSFLGSEDFETFVRAALEANERVLRSAGLIE